MSVPVRVAPGCRTDLIIGGMTCGACAHRIERKLSKIDGVRAVVNYATEKATVTHPDTISPQELITTIERAGFSAALPQTAPAPPAVADPAADPDADVDHSSPSAAAGCWSAPR